MNLLNRRHVQFKVMESSKAFLVPMPGERAFLWLDKDQPSAEQLPSRSSSCGKEAC